MSLESNKGGAHSPPSSPLKLDYWLSSTLFCSFKKLFFKKTINIHCTWMLPTSGSRYDGIKSQKSTWSFLVTGVDKKQSNNRTMFVWPWNENAPTNQKQQTNGNRANWLVYRTDTNARGFWLAKRTLRRKNFMPENFTEINRYFALTSYCNTIGQSNNAFSMLGFSLAGKLRVRVLIFSSIGL